MSNDNNQDVKDFQSQAFINSLFGIEVVSVPPVNESGQSSVNVVPMPLVRVASRPS